MGGRSVVVSPRRRGEPRRRYPSLARARTGAPDGRPLADDRVRARQPDMVVPGRASCAGSIRYRVVAVDQLGMGYTDRTASRRYVDRVRDLDDVIGALDLRAELAARGPAHDWGGAIAMGWAVEDQEQLAGLILCNTGIAVPEGRSAPGIIRLAACRGCSMRCRPDADIRRGHGAALGRRITKIDAKPSVRPTGVLPLGRRSPISSPTSRSTTDIRRRQRSPTSPIGSGRSAHRCCWRGEIATRCSTTTSRQIFAGRFPHRRRTASPPPIIW